MVQAIKQTVRIQPGGRLEVMSPDLPDGEMAEVIVLLPARVSPVASCMGLFVDEPELMDEIVADALAAREHPLRRGNGQGATGH
jgi:hypothetical protein